MTSRLVDRETRPEDALDSHIRPQTLAEFVGQAKAKQNLQVFIAAAKQRGEALDHVLFVGPPGLGKTTLAQIVARELGVGFRATSGPVIAKAGDLAALLTNLEERDVLFIDEIHRLNPAVEEVLYPAMEDFQLDLIIGEGPAARSVKIDLSKFTLVGATTRAGLLTNPLRDRFGIPIRLNFYTEAELEDIVTRGARVLGIGMSKDGANEIARRSRGTAAHRFRALQQFFKWAIGEGLISASPMVRMRQPRVIEQPPAILDFLDLQAVEHRAQSIAHLQRVSPFAVAYVFEHLDGFRTTIFHFNGTGTAFSRDTAALNDFTYAGLTQRGDVLSTLMFLPMPPTMSTLASFFSPLVNHIERMVLTGQTAWPIERNYLTTGMTLFAVDSLFADGAKLATPDLRIRYQPTPGPPFWLG